MSTIAVKIKHAGKTYDVQADLSKPGLAFKQSVFELTGVPVDKVKVVCKGGMLKDHADLKKVGFKEGQQFMVIGAATELPKPPSTPVMFLEDMTDAELAQAVKTPGGLQNLGNTCYMASSLQVLRVIPELQIALNAYTPQGGASQRGDTNAGLTSGLRHLYQEMGKTTEAYAPQFFWHLLRQHVPQFQEMRNGFPAQQDAEECWSAILGALRPTLNGVKAPGNAEGSTTAAQAQDWVQQYLMGEMQTETKTVEAPEEEASVSIEPFLELKCNITSETNYLANGIKDSLEQQLEKNSSSLGRSAVYTSTSRVSRLPAYLTVHQNRFFWRREINKKTKILRKVKFPFEMDVSDILTPELQKKIRPANDRFKEIQKARHERAVIRKKSRRAADEQVKSSTSTTTGSVAASTSTEMDVDPNAPVTETTAAVEPSIRVKEKQELEGLLDPSLKADIGSNATGMYELIGVVSHKGASAEGGHYIGWVKASAANGGQGVGGGNSTGKEDEDPEKEQWIKFDDEKVSMVPRSRVSALDGGGEDSIGYLLLYRSMALE